VRFPFTAEAQKEFIAGARAELAVDHANYRGSGVLSAAQQKSLAADLTD